MGVDEMGVDEMGSRRSGNKPFEEAGKKESWHLSYLTSFTICLI